MSDIQHDWVKEQVGDLQNKSPDNKDAWIGNALKGKKGIVNAQDVFVIQNALKALGHDPGKVDGVYKEKGKNTSNTISAVRDFQSKNGLTIDGQVGPETIAKLIEKLGTPAKSADTAPAKSADTAPAKSADTAPAKSADTAPAKSADTAPAKSADTAPAKSADTAPAKSADTAPAKSADTAPAKSADTAPAKSADTAPAKSADTAPAKSADTAPAPSNIDISGIDEGSQQTFVDIQKKINSARTTNLNVPELTKFEQLNRQCFQTSIPNGHVNIARTQYTDALISKLPTEDLRNEAYHQKAFYLQHNQGLGSISLSEFDRLQSAQARLRLLQESKGVLDKITNKNQRNKDLLDRVNNQLSSINRTITEINNKLTELQKHIDITEVASNEFRRLGITLTKKETNGKEQAPIMLGFTVKQYTIQINKEIHTSDDPKFKQQPFTLTGKNIDFKDGVFTVTENDGSKETIVFTEKKTEPIKPLEPKKEKMPATNTGNNVTDLI